MDVRLNLNYYKGSDLYSDGDIENEILNIFKNELNIVEILKNDNRWPILYHISPEREKLLKWYPFKKGSSLLEIGAGCGALTGLFCEKVKKVIAVELSKKRSEIIYNRHKQAKNLEIIVGNLKDLRFQELFDYITLIGVLEYTKSFINTKNPYKTLLDIIYRLLNKDGKLIIAIENKFGLKYFAGAMEDHTGQLFSGIEGYHKIDNVETFGKEEIIEILRSNGFPTLEFYYPYPDYKLPNEIYSDKCLPDINNLLMDSSNYDKERFKFFSEQLGFLNIIKNKYFDFFSNSFLIIASRRN